MSFLLYLAVLSVSVTSVLLGLDWLASPPPAPVRHVQVARTTAPLVAPPVKPVTKVRTVAAPPQAKAATPDAVVPQQAAVAMVTKPEPAAPAKPEKANAETTATAAVDVASSPPPDQPAAQPGTQPEIAAAPPPAPRCDVQACSRAYVSFDASNCTWQPYDGPRRFCDKGTPPRPAASVMPDAATPAQAQARVPACNVKACSRAYVSFDASDCTWQPYEGRRQLCEK